MSKIVTMDLLAFFKTKQDAANEKIFIQAADYIDENGNLKTEKIPTQSHTDVIPIHVVTVGGQTKYFTDNEGVKTSTEVMGQTAKIYVDLESGSRFIYTYDEASGFIPFATSVATEADIEALFN